MQTHYDMVSNHLNLINQLDRIRASSEPDPRGISVTTHTTKEGTVSCQDLLRCIDVEACKQKRITQSVYVSPRAFAKLALRSLPSALITNGFARFWVTEHPHLNDNEWLYVTRPNQEQGKTE